MIIEPPAFADYQKSFLYNPERFTIVEASTKTGKTFSMIFWLFEIAHGFQNKKKVMDIKAGMNFWWVAPVYSQAKIAFNRLWRIVVKSGLYSQNKSEMTITTPAGTIISFKTAQDPDNLYGEDVYGAVFDEFTRAKQESWFALRSTLTATKAKCKFIGNYKGNSNWGHQLGLKSETDSNYKYYRITAYDAVKAGILDKKEVEQARKDLPSFMFKALYLAEGDIDKSRLIHDDSINNLYTNDFVVSGKKYLTADLAFAGSDLFVILIWSGLRVIDYKVMDISTGKDIELTIKELANKHQVPRSYICYDADGVGMYLEGYLKGSVSFKNGSPALLQKKKKVEYRNLKSQCQFKLAEKINANEIYIECDLDRYKNVLNEELEAIKNRGLDSEGKLETLKKKEVRELIGRSPDFVDALTMRMYFEIKPAMSLASVNIASATGAAGLRDRL
jgi:hypothetical protein|tara:strand:- start:6287 stop:7624 length:1338 start_codon:yes stop_codon:yes gene_type:complete